MCPLTCHPNGTRSSEDIGASCRFCKPDPTVLFGPAPIVAGFVLGYEFIPHQMERDNDTDRNDPALAGLLRRTSHRMDWVVVTAQSLFVTSMCSSFKHWRQLTASCSNCVSR